MNISIWAARQPWERNVDFVILESVLEYLPLS